MFNNISFLYDDTEGGVEPLLVGLLGAPSMNFDRFLNPVINEYTYGMALLICIKVIL